MPLTHYGSAMSTARVLTVLYELDLAHEFVHVDIAKGEHKTPAYGAKQPFGKVPVLDDGGFEVFESRAMCRYLFR